MVNTPFFLPSNALSGPQVHCCSLVLWCFPSILFSVQLQVGLRHPASVPPAVIDVQRLKGSRGGLAALPHQLSDVG